MVAQAVQGSMTLWKLSSSPRAEEQSSAILTAVQEYANSLSGLAFVSQTTCEDYEDMLGFIAMEAGSVFSAEHAADQVCAAETQLWNSYMHDYTCACLISELSPIQVAGLGLIYA